MFAGVSNAWLLVPVAFAAGFGVALLVASRRRRRQHARLEAQTDSLREQLQRAQRMEALGILASSIVHNLNNLLTAILGHARLAMDDLDRRHPAQRSLEQVVRAGQTAGELTREILDFEHTTDSERRPERLQAVVNDTVKLLRDLLPGSVELRTELDPACGPVLASTSQVQQVLLSLCSNAYHSMHRHRGTVTIALSNAEITETREAVPQPLAPGMYVRLSILDDGRGMDAQTLERIFEPYFSGREPRRGAGLGLTTVKRILAAHDGAAISQSQPGHGTRFDIYFPVVVREVQRGDAATGAPPAGVESGPVDLPAPRQRRRGSLHARRAPGTPVRVLLVDDEILVAGMLRTGLERLGYQVTSRAGGPQALATFVENPDAFDVLVSDQIMRGLSGEHLAREIVALRPGLPVILITGFRDSVEVDHAQANGINEVLEKPLSHHDLAAAIERVLADSARRELEDRA